jgi:uncharacterized protein
MNIVKILVIAAILAPVCRADISPTPAPSASMELSYKLMDIAGTSTLMAEGFEMGLKPALDRMKAQGMPDELITAIHDESKRFFDANFKWDEIKPLMAKLYTDSFTESELRDLVAFYETPTGKKAASLMPVLTQKGMAIGMSRIQTHMPEFQQRVGALIQDYRKKAAAAAAATVPAGTSTVTPSPVHTPLPQ